MEGMGNKTGFFDYLEHPVPIESEVAQEVRRLVKKYFLERWIPIMRKNRMKLVIF